MLSRLRRLAVMLVLVAGCRHDVDELGPAPTYAPLVGDGDAVFFVGNSFFAWQGRELPVWVAALGAAMEPPVHLHTAGDIVPGDLPLSAFLEHPATREALASGRYDVFVLQGHEFEPVDRRAAFHQAVRDFHAAVTAAGGKTVLFETWDFHFRPFIGELAHSYEQIGRELGIPVIPAGLAHRDCTREPPPGEHGHWLTADAEHPEGDLHQNAAGTALNAYTTFAILSGRNPEGRNFTAPGNDLDDARLRYLSDMAWRHAGPRLRPAR